MQSYIFKALMNQIIPITKQGTKAVKRTVFNQYGVNGTDHPTPPIA